MPRTKSDPLLSALIAKLPPSDTDWSVDRQLAWLNLMAMAFGAVYGGDAAARLGIKAGEQQKASAAHMPSAPLRQPARNYRFIIDEAGYVRNGKGKRILPSDVTEAITDLRGMDGDLRTIVWADESTGLNGADLTIHTA